MLVLAHPWSLCYIILDYLRVITLQSIHKINNQKNRGHTLRPSPKVLFLMSSFRFFPGKEEDPVGDGTELQVTGAGLLSGGRSDDGSSHQDKHDSNRSHGTVTPASFRKVAARSPSASQYELICSFFYFSTTLTPPFLSHVRVHMYNQQPYCFIHIYSVRF